MKTSSEPHSELRLRRRVAAVALLAATSLMAIPALAAESTPVAPFARLR
ncbi:hypothetical protein [Luteococcus sp.]